MQAKSGLRKLYKAQVYVALAFGLLVTFLLLKFSEFDWRNVLFWMGCLFGGLCTMVIYDLTRPEHLLNEISVDESGITMRFKAPDSLETIPFNAIEKIKVRRRRLYVQRGMPINDGYCDTFLYLKNGKTAVISQDYFENYHEIMLAIYKNFDPKPKPKIFGKVLSGAIIVALLAGFAGCSNEKQSFQATRKSEKISFQQFKSETGLNDLSTTITIPWNEPEQSFIKSRNFTIETQTVNKLSVGNDSNYTFLLAPQIVMALSIFNLIVVKIDGKWEMSIVEMTPSPENWEALKNGTTREISGDLKQVYRSSDKIPTPEPSEKQ